MKSVFCYYQTKHFFKKVIYELFQFGQDYQESAVKNSAMILFKSQYFILPIVRITIFVYNNFWV